MTISLLLTCTYPTCIFSFFLILKIRQELFCEIVKVQYRNSKIIWTRYVFSGALLIQLTQLKKFIMSLITGFRFPSNASRFWLVFQNQYYSLNPSKFCILDWTVGCCTIGSKLSEFTLLRYKLAKESISGPKIHGKLSLTSIQASILSWSRYI